MSGLELRTGRGTHLYRARISFVGCTLNLRWIGSILSGVLSGLLWQHAELQAASAAASNAL